MCACMHACMQAAGRRSSSKHWLQTNTSRAAASIAAAAAATAIISTASPTQHTSPLRPQAWWFEADGEHVKADIRSPAGTVLAHLPARPDCLVISLVPAITTTGATSNSSSSGGTGQAPQQPQPPPPDTPAAEPSSSGAQGSGSAGASGGGGAGGGGRKRWLRLALKGLATGVKVVVLAEVAGFLLGRTRLLRHLGRLERWGGCTACKLQPEGGCSLWCVDWGQHARPLRIEGLDAGAFQGCAASCSAQPHPQAPQGLFAA